MRGNKGRLLQFVYVPSSIGWGVHREAHDCLKELPRIPGRRFESSIGEVRKWVDEITKESWRRNYWGNPGYRGKQFYELYTVVPNGQRARREAVPLLPSLKKEGTWLTALAGKSNAFVARFTRAVLNHAPIGEYRDRFNLLEEGELPLCPECLRRETREHIFNGCIWTNWAVH